MKQNLIKGMAALCVCAAFASCSKDVAYDANFANKQADASYEEAFVKRFGAVSPTQNWDFTKVSKATTRAEETAAKIEQLYFNANGQSTANFKWIWKSTDRNQGELNQSDFKNLWNNYLDDIKTAINSARYTDWNPSQYKNTYFRVFAVSKDGSTKSYQRFGLHLPSGENYWLAQGNPNLEWNTGLNYMDHTRYLDFTQLPEGTSWFIISQVATKENTPIKASDNQLLQFKEVTVELGDKNYTFWAFNCNGDNNGVADLILWVKAEKKPVERIIKKRYMAEDLGGTCDFDFNDVVFDIVENNDGQKGYVRALGGMLDIAILVNGVQCWRKSLDARYPIKQMFNTGYKGSAIDYHATLAEFDVTGWNENENNVSIIVYQDGSSQASERLINFPIVGSIPRMIAVDVRKHWQKEEVGIFSMDWFTQLDEE